MAGGGSSLPAPTGDAKKDARVLAEALSSLAQATLLQGIKSMTTDLDALFLQLKNDFQAQVALCDRFRALALEYRPIRNEAVSVVVSFKDFADSVTTMFIPMLCLALDEGDVVSIKDTIDELVETFQRVLARLGKLKTEHNEITVAARQLSDQAANIAHHNMNKKASADMNKKASAVTAVGAAVSAGAGGGIHYVAGGAVIFGGSPIGWLGLGVGGVVALGSAMTLLHQDQASAVFRALQESATRINEQMNRVTVKLEGQCIALEKIVSKLQLATDSTHKIQALIDAWSDEGAGRTKAQEFRVKLWLKGKFPQDMEELSGHCVEYLGNEAEERARLVSAMNIGELQPSARSQLLTASLRSIA